MGRMCSILYPDVGGGEQPGAWPLNPWHAGSVSEFLKTLEKF